MLQSRFFPRVCRCSLPVDQVKARLPARLLQHHPTVRRNNAPTQAWDLCLVAAQSALRDLGRAHSERAYEECMTNFFYQHRIPYMRQRAFYREVRGDIIPVGVADLEVAHCVILELKVGNNAITEDHRQQLLRYMQAARERNGDRAITGGVLLFGRDGSLRVWKQEMPAGGSPDSAMLIE